MLLFVKFELIGTLAMIACWIYLVVCYWKMFFQVKWDIPILNISISRLWAFFLFTFLVLWASVNQQYLLEKVFAFSFLLLILEVYRISNRCGTDPVHLFYLNVRFYHKYVLLALVEVFGPAFFVLLAFLVLHIDPENQLSVLLGWLYVMFALLKLTFGVLSNRFLQFTVVYLWILIVLGAVSGGMSGLLHADTDEITKILDRLLWENFDQVVHFIQLSCVVFSIFGFALAYGSFRRRPFVDPHSLPKRLL